jgi:hypothetical protein
MKRRIQRRTHSFHEKGPVHLGKIETSSPYTIREADDRVPITPELHEKSRILFKELIDNSPAEAFEMLIWLHTNLICNFFEGNLDDLLDVFCRNVKYNVAQICNTRGQSDLLNRPYIRERTRPS